MAFRGDLTGKSAISGFSVGLAVEVMAIRRDEDAL
jgi:hypothetical protein